MSLRLKHIIDLKVQRHAIISLCAVLAVMAITLWQANILDGLAICFAVITFAMSKYKEKGREITIHKEELVINAINVTRRNNIRARNAA